MLEGGGGRDVQLLAVHKANKLAFPNRPLDVPLEYVQEGDEEWLVCHTCGRRYPVRDDIPVLLIEEGDKYREEGVGSKAE